MTKAEIVQVLWAAAHRRRRSVISPGVAIRVPPQTYVAAGVIGAVIGTALVHSAPGRQRVPSPLSAEQAHAFYDEAVAHEVDERADSVRKFRSSEWSQQDEFHNRESTFIRNYSRSHHVALRSTLDALDQGMRQKWSTKSPYVPRQTVIPCRPRLTY
jgi:hypothetical protein